MAKHVAEEGEGRARGYEVYGIIRDLIEQGKDAEFVDKSGCYLVNWDRAIECYVDRKRKKDPDFNHSRPELSNRLRSALLTKSHKKDGAKEHSESKKRNNDDEVVMRKFQMPRKVFKFFFGNDNSEEQDEQGAGKAGSSTDAGYDTTNITYGLSERVNLGSLNDPANVPGTYNQGRSSDIQMISAKPKEISTQVEGSCRIIPDSGSVKGGYEFVISYTEPLPDTVSSGMAEFEGVHKVELEKLNPYTFMGSVPASPFAHCVEVKVTSQCGDCLGITSFRYFDEMVDVTRQIVQNLGEQAALFSYMSQDPDPQNFEFQGNLDSTLQAKHKQSVKILEVLVYTAAQIGAKPFIKMIFSTSAKKTVFDSYKDRAQLPEDVARANGHCNLARYLQDITMRLTKDADEKPKTMDWLELLKAVQNQVSVSQDKESEEETTSVESDDNSSDYFADTETSSCGSFEEDDVFTSNSEGKDATEKGESKERLLEDPPYSSTPDANHLVDSKSPDNEKQNGSSFLGVIHDDVDESFLSGVCVDGAVSRDRYKKKITDVHFPEEENNKHLVTAENAAVKTNNDTASVCHLRKENHRQDLVPKKVYRTCQDPGMHPLPPTLWPCRAGETSSKRTECRSVSRIKEGKRLLMTENVVISASNFRILKKVLDCSVVPNALERLLNQEKSFWNARFELLIFSPPSVGKSCFTDSMKEETLSEATKCRGIYESKEEKRALITENVAVSASTCRLKRPGYLGLLSAIKADERQLNQELVIFEKSIGDESVHSPSTLLPSCSVLSKSPPQSSCSASLHGLFSGNVSWKNESNMKDLKFMARVRSWLRCNPNSEEFPSAEAASQDKESKEETTPADSDDNSSDYFANAETSCGSFEYDDEFTSNPEGKDTAEKDSPTGVSKERLLEDPPYSSIPDANHMEDSKPPDEKQSGSSFLGFFLREDLYFNPVFPSIKKTPLIDLNVNRVLSSIKKTPLIDLYFNPVFPSIKKTPLIGWIDNSLGFSFGICLSIAEMKAIARKVCGRCCSIVEMKEIAREIFDTVHITVGNSAQFLGGSPSKWINCRELSRYESKQEKRVLMAENVVVSASTCRLKRPGYLVLSPLEADERQLHQEQFIFEKSIDFINNAPPQTDSSASLHGVSSGNVSWKNESSIKELKMARVRSWLSCNPNSEEFPSAEGF